MDKWHLCLHRVCKVLGVSVFYQTKSGIKVLNTPPVGTELTETYFDLSDTDLFLGFDWLKDEFTSCGMCINDSPHLDFMETLESEGDFDFCSYVMKRRAGALDGLFPEKLDPEKCRVKFLEMKKLILSDDYNAVTVFPVDGKYYILDGKHRAALCSMLGKSVHCRLIEIDSLKTSVCFKKYYKAMSNKNGYDTNISLLKHLYS